jgi:ATP adenylyltransferase
VSAIQTRESAMLRPDVRFQSGSDFDQPLFQSQHFLCVPSLGSMVPGWVLITPRRQVLNMSQLADVERHDLASFFPMVRRAIENQFGEISAFEHGAWNFGSLTGCGVDQAHLHIVPISFATLAGAVSDLQWEQAEVALPCDIGVAQIEYLWMAGSKSAWISYPPEPTSQFFRRALSTLLNRSWQWDYRLHPFHDNIAATRRKLRAAFGPSVSRAA